MGGLGEVVPKSAQIGAIRLVVVAEAFVLRMPVPL